MIPLSRASEIIEEEQAQLTLSQEGSTWIVEDPWFRSDARLGSEQSFRLQVRALRDNEELPLYVEGQYVP